MSANKEDLPSGGYILTGSMEDIFEKMGRMEESAMSELYPEQLEMLSRKGDQYYLSMVMDFPIFGEAWSLERAAKSELASYGVETPQQLSKEDLEAFMAAGESLAESRARGYIFGKAYSIVCPEGELGSTHVSQMWPIDKEVFDEAKSQDWRPGIQDSPHFRKALEAYFKRETQK